MAKEFDVCVIGSGPGGYVAAIRASQLGFNTAIVEKRHLGGVCLNIGCIPTKALLRSAEVFESIENAGDYGVDVQGYSADFGNMIERSRSVADKMNKGVQFLMKANNIEVFEGTGIFESNNQIKITGDNGTIKEKISAKNFIIATGARPRQLPDVKINGERVIDYEQAIKLKEQPDKLLVIGAGAIGVEFAYFYHTIGTEVTLIELQEDIVPAEDKDISRELGKIYKKKGINVMTESAVEKVDKTEKGVKATIMKPESTEQVEADLILLAVGVTGSVDGIGLDKAGVEYEGDIIPVDKETYQTNVEGIYAIGDVTGGPWLAHKASHEGINCVEIMAGENPLAIDYNNIPACTYCEPQVASVGYTEQQAKDEDYDVKVGKFPFSASGKAKGLGHEEGFVKVVFDAQYGEWLGCHMIGSHVTELIAEVITARDLETTAQEIIHAAHPHPTMSEAIMEAVAEAFGEGIHLGN